MASYMTTMFQIARSIFQNKPVAQNDVVKEVSAPLEIIKAPVPIHNDVVKEVSTPVEIITVPVVPTQNDEVKEVSTPVEIISAPVPVVSTQNDVVKEVSTPLEIISVPVVPTQNDVVKEVSEPEPGPIVVPENTQTESVESVPKRKPRGKNKKLKLSQ